MLVDLQQRSCKVNYNIPPCYGEHRTNREKRLSELLHDPKYVDIDVPHLLLTIYYMVRDLLIDIQLRCCTEKYNIPPCCGEHWTNRDRRLSELLHDPEYVDIDVQHLLLTLYA